MRTTARGASLLALAVLLLPAGNQARADELLVMPFACAVEGGRPILSPAPEQSHRVVGPREQRNFTACSPVNPDLCRNWTVHRFVLDCDGARVPWVEVVAAEAEQTNQRAWLENGRLRLRMEPTWTLEPDDRCAQGPPWLDRRMRRYCAERQTMGPPAVVEMPFGFAPMLGIDGFFVKAAPGFGPAPPPAPPVALAPPAPEAPPAVAAPPPPPKAARAEPPQPPRSEPAPPARTEPPQPPRVEPPRDTAAKEAPAKSPPPAVAPPAAVKPAPKVATPAPPPASPTGPAATPGGPVIPKIINRPEAPAAEAPAAPAPTPAAPKPAPATSEPAAKDAAGPPPPKDATKELARKDLPRQPKTTAVDESQSITVSLLSVVRSPATAIAFAFAGLTAALLTVFALARRRERTNLAGRRPRDIATVSLDGRGKRAKPAARLGYTRGKLPPNAAASAMNRVPFPEQGAAGEHSAPAHWGDDIPRTRAEALQVLGMGVAPSANDAALKKMVDGLRLSWHPDLAKDEADRQLRELRLKQINAAWEIIQGKRGEV